MKSNKRALFVIVILLLMPVLLVSCAAGSGATPSGITPSPMPTTPPPSPAASEPVQSPPPDAGFQDLGSLVTLIGMTKEDLLASIGEDPADVDEGGLGFEKTGIRVWFDTQTYTKAAQVLIMSDAIDINGAKIGDGFDAFQDIFGTPVSDQNGDAHFQYGELYLSVVRDTSTDTVIGVYILAEDF